MKNLNIFIGIGTLLLVTFLFIFFSRQNTNFPPLGGNYPTPLCSSASIINSSSSFGAGGVNLITNASNTGIWLRITNIGATRVFCGATNNTSTLNIGGQLLASIASSTGANYWEATGIKGPISCVGDASSIITYSYCSEL